MKKLKSTVKMKSLNYKLNILFVLCFSIMILSANSQSKEIDFEKGSFSEIKAKAKKENKLIFMDCYTTWCGPCKMMAKETFTNDTVYQFYNEHFINCSFDMEKGEGIELAKNYKVGCYPTLLFIDGDGKIVHRSAGYMGVSDFMKFSDVAMNSQKNFSSIEKNYQNNKENGLFVVEFIKILSSSCMNYNEVLQNYLSIQKEEDLINEYNWGVISKFVTDINSKEFKYVLNHLDLFRDKYTASEVNQFLAASFSTALRDYGQDSRKTITDLENLFLVIKNTNLKGFTDTVLFYNELNFYSAKKDWKSYIALAMKDGDRFLNLDNTNEICWNIYLNSDDKKVLNKAIKWMVKYKDFYKVYYDWALSGNVNETPNNESNPAMINFYAENIVYAPWDTYAALLFKVKNKKEAKLNAENAIKVAKRFEIDGSETEELLKSIQKLK